MMRKVIFSLLLSYVYSLQAETFQQAGVKSPAAFTVTLPHVVQGGNNQIFYSSSLLLSNLSAQKNIAHVDYLDPRDSRDFPRWANTVVLPPRGTVETNGLRECFCTEDPGRDFQGWATLNATGPLVVVQKIELRRGWNGPLLSEVTMKGTDPLSEALLPVKVSTITNTGFAIANPTPLMVPVQADLLDSAGNLAASRQLFIGPFQKYSSFVTETFNQSQINFGSDFVGRLQLRSGGPPFSVTGLFLTENVLSAFEIPVMAADKKWQHLRVLDQKSIGSTNILTSPIGVILSDESASSFQSLALGTLGKIFLVPEKGLLILQGVGRIAAFSPDPSELGRYFILDVTARKLLANKPVPNSMTQRLVDVRYISSRDAIEVKWWGTTFNFDKVTYELIDPMTFAVLANYEVNMSIGSDPAKAPPPPWR